MKSERRHELQHNELADWLAKIFDAIKPYQNVIAVAVVGLLVVGIGYTYWAKESASQMAKAWDELNIAMTGNNPMSELAQVIDMYSGTPVAYSAEIVLADMYLAGGCDRLFQNKANGNEDLKNAIKLYDGVLSQCREPAYQERATFGLARAKEALADADSIKQAIQYYKEVAQKWPSGAYADAAKGRAADLERPQTLAIYDRFARFDPKPAFSPEAGVSGGAGLNSIPSEPQAQAEASKEPASDATSGAEQPVEKTPEAPKQ